ncbi:MAG: TraB/GumN family protein [Desulfobacterales bacterium]|nr:TraB/GumN family protein [Desulfobacterales bacterium]
MSIKDRKCFFWKITIGNNTVFLIGSMHLMRKDMYPLPDKFENAFLMSPIMVFEINLEEANAQELKQYVHSLGLYPAGETIWKNISQNTQKKLLEKLSEIKFPINVAERIRPWLLSMMLEDTSKKDNNSKLQQALGLDVYFFQKAKQEGKKIIFLETTRDQIDCSAKLPAREQEFLLKDALRKQPMKGEIPLHDVIELWKSGDADTLEFHYRKHHKKQMKIYQNIIINRNRTWLKKIEELFQLSKNVMIVVGGGHVGGPDGLVQLLSDKGYQIVQE